MSDETAFIARIVIEYAIAEGKFSLNSNIHDEVITTGMVEMAKDKLKENYQLTRIKELQNKQENGLIVAH